MLHASIPVKRMLSRFVADLERHRRITELVGTCQGVSHVICPNSDAPFSVNKRSEVCQPQPSLLVFVLAIEAYDLVLCLALTILYSKCTTMTDTSLFSPTTLAKGFICCSKCTQLS